jgi:hypothetical protein
MERLWSLVGATGGNRWQGEGSETAQIRENRCRGLPPVAAENGREGSTAAAPSTPTTTLSPTEPQAPHGVNVHVHNAGVRLERLV